MSDQTGLACRPNIGPRQRQVRMVLSVVAAAIAAAVAAFLLTSGAPRVWRLAVFPAVWSAVLSYLEARSHTCVVLAARGLRNMDAGNERVPDDADRRASTAQSRTIYVRSTMVAAIITAAVLLVP